MRRVSALLLLALLAACGGPGSQTATNDQNIRVADAALGNGSPAVALQILEATLKADPRNVDALVRQGKANAALGNDSAAETSFRRALAIDGGNAEARIGLGRLMMAVNAAEAEKMFAAVVAKDPKNTAALNNLGVSRDLQGKHPEAQEAYNQALAVNPGLASAKTNLALSLAVSGRPQEGAAMLNQIARGGAGGRKARDNLAVALALSGDTTQAAKVMREELNQSDTSAAIEGFKALRAQQ